MKKINENVIHNIVSEVLKESLGGFYRGYEIQNGQPQNVEDVFKGDGWVIKGTKQLKDGSTAYAVSRATGAFGAFNGVEAQDMVEELNIVLQKEGKHAEYKGPGKVHKYIEIFIIK